MAPNFQGVSDRYNGVTVDSVKEPCDVSQFTKTLSDSLDKWNEDKKRCIWFKVRIKDAAWVPLLANEGFNFHHSRDDFVMMYKWLPKDTTANLPPACHTNLGVGGIVINEKNEILVVVEQHTEIQHWKLPGGYVERGEDIRDAAVREVWEETGIETEFQSLITFRHTHKMMFDNSDIYVVVLLKPKSDTINKSDIEIEACKWMDVQEYLNHENVIEFNRFIVSQAIHFKGKNIKLDLEKRFVKYAKLKRDVTCLILKDEDTFNTNLL